MLVKYLAAFVIFFLYTSISYSITRVYEIGVSTPPDAGSASVSTIRNTAPVSFKIDFPQKLNHLLAVRFFPTRVLDTC